MQHGVKSVSVDEIAAKLGMSKRTIYQQFQDKEDIVIYFLDYYSRHQLQNLQRLFKTLPTVIDVFLYVMEMHRETALSYNIKFQEDIEKYFPKAQKKLEELTQDHLTMIKGFLQKGIEQGVIRADLNLEVTAFLMQDTKNTYTSAMRTASRSFSAWELFFASMINFMRGISTENGIKIVDDYLNVSPAPKWEGINFDKQQYN